MSPWKTLLLNNTNSVWTNLIPNFTMNRYLWIINPNPLQYILSDISVYQQILITISYALLWRSLSVTAGKYRVSRILSAWSSWYWTHFLSLLLLIHNVVTTQRFLLNGYLLKYPVSMNTFSLIYWICHIEKSNFQLQHFDYQITTTCIVPLY